MPAGNGRKTPRGGPAKAETSAAPAAAGLPPGAIPPPRVVIETVTPQVEGGRFPAKRCVGDEVEVQAKVFTDGHDLLAAEVLHRRQGEEAWTSVPMSPLGNDSYAGSFPVAELGGYEYAVAAWIDPYGTWLAAAEKRAAAGQDMAVELVIASEMMARAAANAPAGEDADRLARAAGELTTLPVPNALQLAAVEAPAVQRYQDRPSFACSPALPLVVERERARTGAWYEFFPRSTGLAGEHGTFATAIERLEYAASMGFDVVYLPPVHPIGREHRKGPNNTLVPGPGDPGSPWAIGAAEGGHCDLHPELGTLADFEAFVRRATELGIEIAVDIAFQCAPDHPWLEEHPGWFNHLPDGTIRHAENPPKKYEDIVPFDFECEDWRALWEALREVVLTWAERGVLIFRVDNPHTKPFPFWEWLIASVRERHPGAVFLSEAFTRPAVLHRLAKVGFSQSYTYFAWRNTKEEITSYMTELTSSPGRDYLRPNLWPNTPDILTEYLQTGGRPAFVSRFVLAATLGASYGIYGPAFELCEGRAREPGSEEYLDSEKYQLRHWDVASEWSLRSIITKVNGIRRQHPALHRDWSLRFHPTDNDRIICYTKQAPGDLVLVVVNLDPHYRQAGFVDLGGLDFDFSHPYQVHDLLGEGRYLWEGPRNYVELDPHTSPAHVFVLRTRVRSEHDFEYFL